MVESAKNRSDGDSTVASLRLVNGCLQAEASVRAIMLVAVDELGHVCC
jgi:hypothetical protein